MRLAVLIAIFIAIMVGAVWFVRQISRTVVYESRPVGVMGTTCRIAAVGNRGALHEACVLAERELRRIEALMSTWIDDSELSKFNRSDKGGLLDGDLCKVIQFAEKMYKQSDGAFDITAKPIFDLWKQSAERGRTPGTQQIEQARSASNWDLLTLSGTDRNFASKLKNTVCVEVAGLAKGYSVDWALRETRTEHIAGALVEVGGDIACFGRQNDGSPWRVKVKNPFGEGTVMTLELPEGGAVCTSGNYARYYEIAGKRYSRIIDPRTGWPTAAAAGVTVIAPDCMTADAWATALSVLGPAGLEKINAIKEIDAMLITGDAEDRQYHYSEGFKRYIAEER